jgi:hypothetical protein
MRAGNLRTDVSVSCCSGLQPLSLVVAVELALGVDALDAGVDVGLLILVDPAGWDPFG